MDTTDTDLTAVARQISEGTSLLAICRDRGLPYQTVRLALIKAGLPSAREAIPVVSSTRQAAEMWDAGRTLAEIATHLGVSKQAVSRSLWTAEKHGLLTRPTVKTQRAMKKGYRENPAS